MENKVLAVVGGTEVTSEDLQRIVQRYPEDRRGYFVTFDTSSDKIRKATSSDNFILGAVSSNPAILGDSQSEGWKNKYVKDEWDQVIYERKYVDLKSLITANSDNSEAYERTSEGFWCESPIISENYISDKEYVPREKRKEWSPVGLMGKLLVHSDGTCRVGDFCKSNDDGIATKSDTGYYVLEVRDNNIIKVLIK